MEEILLVEDEPSLARFIELELQHEGYHVTCAADGKNALRMALEHDYDLIILDLMIPELSGIEVCTALRSRKTTPIIMLTAKSTTKDRVNGLDCGADDYITKPFDIEELCARIRSVRRRSLPGNSTRLTYSDLVIDTASIKVTRSNIVIDLSTREYELLKYLLQQPNVVASREELLHRVWGYQFSGETNVVDVYIRYLRAKIDEPFPTKLIHTVRGFGYVMREQDPVHAAGGANHVI